MREWFSTPWGEDDVRTLGVVVGSHRHQATFEALAVLVAIRAWAHMWAGANTVVRGKSDSMATIGAVGKLRSGSRAINAIVREVALDMSAHPTGFALELQHLAGDRNQWADALSRLMEPGSGAVVPGPLRALRRREVAERGASWWRAGGVEAEVVCEEGEESGVLLPLSTLLLLLELSRRLLLLLQDGE